MGSERIPIRYNCSYTREKEGIFRNKEQNISIVKRKYSPRSAKILRDLCIDEGINLNRPFKLDSI